MVVKISARGTLQPGNQVDVGTEVSGRVDQVLVDFDDHVKAGQLIAVINTDTTKAQMAQFQASLAQAKATLATNQATVEQTTAKRTRYHTLVSSGAVPVQDMQTVDADYARALASVALAKAQIQSAEAQIDNSQAQLNKAQIRSPIDGVVLDRKVSPGQTVAASFSTPVVFTLASDLSVMQLAVDIDEADIGSVHPGQLANFTVDAFANKHFTARLASVHNSPKTVNGVVSYPGVLLVDNRDGLLRPGLTATVEIVVAAIHGALTVPNAALRFTPPVTSVPKPPARVIPTGDRLGGRVWVMAGQAPEPRDLIIGKSNGRITEVLSGKLSPGESVITDIKTKRPAAATGGAP